MKRQVLKIENRYCFSVIWDSVAPNREAYSLYYKTARVNKDGYLTKRKYLVTKEGSLQACLKWIINILNNKETLREAQSSELRKIYKNGEIR